MNSKKPSAPTGPRIYNLFPPLIGSVQKWEEHLQRIADMRFNWIFLNPFHQVGASGSLYSVKDYYQLNPLFQGNDHKPADELLRHFVRCAEKHNLRVMMDLVINHTAIDSPLVEQNPEWYVHEKDGSVRSPRTVDPDDPQNVVVWKDLADVDFEHSSRRKELLDYWKDVARHYARLGFHGFRCDAAYKVPADAWQEIIEAGGEVDPRPLFFAETLGAKLNQVMQLHSAGFDYFFNSCKWWDFHSSWLLDQYEKLRHIARSIAFPESHDTERLAAETSGDERQLRLWYLLAAFFSTGVMMPVGYEFGFRKRLHVVETRPKDWEKTSCDLSSFIRAANEMKARTPVLNEEGPQERVTGTEPSLAWLLRRSDHSDERALALINTDANGPHDFSDDDLQRLLGAPREDIREITPPTPDISRVKRISLPPLTIRIFHRE